VTKGGHVLTTSTRRKNHHRQNGGPQADTNPWVEGKKGLGRITGKRLATEGKKKSLVQGVAMKRTVELGGQTQGLGGEKRLVAGVRRTTGDELQN